MKLIPLILRFMVVSALAVLVLPASDALACSCMDIPPPMEAMGQADAVFIGRVLSAAPVESTNGFVYTMLVHAVWKGAATTEIQVETGEDLAELGSPLAVEDMTFSWGIIKARYE